MAFIGYRIKHKGRRYSMKLWFQWGLLAIGWFLSSVSIRIWPRLSEINQSLQDLGLPKGEEIELGNREDLIAIIFFKPFHYLISFLFLVFFIFIVSYLTRKTIYECKVSYLLREVPYESIILFVFVLVLYIKAAYYFSYLAFVLTGLVFIYDFITYLPKRRKDTVYVREG
jgi:hypothetical protein